MIANPVPPCPNPVPDRVLRTLSACPPSKGTGLDRVQPEGLSSTPSGDGVARPTSKALLLHARRRPAADTGVGGRPALLLGPRPRGKTGISIRSQSSSVRRSCSTTGDGTRWSEPVLHHEPALHHRVEAKSGEEGEDGQEHTLDAPAHRHSICGHHGKHQVDEREICLCIHATQHCTQSRPHAETFTTTHSAAPASQPRGVTLAAVHKTGETSHGARQVHKQRGGPST